MTSAWYSTVRPGESLTQGDIIWECPVMTWSADPGKRPEIVDEAHLKAIQETIRIDLVIMTQACDMEQEKVEDVILCPHWGIQDYRNQHEQEMRFHGHSPTAKSWSRHCEDIRSGFYWSRSMLNAETGEGYNVDHRIVFFDQIFTLPRAFLESFIDQCNQQRVRLNPPYREHLSQAFARYFMRVGLPVGIDPVWKGN